MKPIKLLSIFILLIVLSCTNNPCEKYQKNRDNVVLLNNNIVDIETKLILGSSSLRVIDSILIITEFYPEGKRGVHLFNKNTFKYICSTAIIGKGPGEVIRQGSTELDRENRILWISDHGKMVLWKFPLDSILNNSNYKPRIKKSLHTDLFIDRYEFLNDSIALGKAVSILPTHKFVKKMAKLNISTNKIEKFGYEHSEAVAKKSISNFCLSEKNNMYVNAYAFCDLLSICDLQGNLKYNIYGPAWKKNKRNRKKFFTKVILFKEHIISIYNGKVFFYVDERGREQVRLPTKLQVFDLEGNYKKTIETEHPLLEMCADEENNRLLVYFDDRPNPLGYINMENLLRNE